MTVPLSFATTNETYVPVAPESACPEAGKVNRDAVALMIPRSLAYTVRS